MVSLEERIISATFNPLPCVPNFPAHSHILLDQIAEKFADVASADALRKSLTLYVVVSFSSRSLPHSVSSSRHHTPTSQLRT